MRNLDKSWQKGGKFKTICHQLELLKVVTLFNPKEDYKDEDGDFREGSKSPFLFETQISLMIGSL